EQIADERVVLDEEEAISVLLRQGPHAPRVARQLRIHGEHLREALRRRLGHVDDLHPIRRRLAEALRRELLEDPRVDRELLDEPRERERHAYGRADLEVLLERDAED